MGIFTIRRACSHTEAEGPELHRTPERESTFANVRHGRSARALVVGDFIDGADPPVMSSRRLVDTSIPGVSASVLKFVYPVKS